MRIKVIELEATGDELRTNRTLLEAIADAVADITNGIGNMTMPLPEDDAEESGNNDE